MGAAMLVAVAYGGICNDKRTDCANWARDGECSGENAVRCQPLCRRRFSASWRLPRLPTIAPPRLTLPAICV